MPEGVPSLLIATIVLVILSGLFSATETAYSSLNEIKIKCLVQQDKKYKKVLKLFDKFVKSDFVCRAFLFNFTLI